MSITIKPTVKLSGENGNAFYIMGQVNKELLKAGYTKEQIALYNKEVMSGDYDNLLRTTMRWVNVV